MTRWRLIALGVLTPWILAAQQSARQRTCNLELFNYDSTTTLAIKLPSGQYNSYYGRGVRGRCSNTDQRLNGDSLEAMGDLKTYTLIGRAHYEEKRVRLDADRITYLQQDERILAEGNVVAVTEKGTTLRGPIVEYYRAAVGLRAESRLFASGRPVTRISPSDAGGETADTVQMIANQVLDVADSMVYAGGDVIISRPDLTATSDSATLDSPREFARLSGRPRIEGKGESIFTLVGKQIDLWSRNRRLERVLSSKEAKATNEDMTLHADSIDLRLVSQKLSKAYAWGKSRAQAHATDRDIFADSIHIEMPDQLLRELRAVGTAIAKSRTDSTKFVSTEEDWLRGDTLVAVFDSVKAAGDSTARPVIQRIFANGNAASLYQVASSEGAKTAPNLNYVKGKAITVQFGDDRAVQTVSVREQASGIYLERLITDSTKSNSRKADSTETKADRASRGTEAPAKNQPKPSPATPSATPLPPAKKP